MFSHTLPAFALLLSGAGEPTGDLKKMQGAWEAVSFVVEGKELPEKERKTLKLVVKGDRGTFTMDGKEVHGQYALDESASPRAIDITITEGPDKGKKKLGIYEIKDGTLRLCAGPLGGKRPAKFASTPGSGVWLEEWRPRRAR
jgi:uncharacterized protein (TIGR03067 family)